MVGENWTQVLIPREEAIGQAFSAVEICPSDPDIVYAGSDAAVYRSEDGGLTWVKMTAIHGGWGPTRDTCRLAHRHAMRSG